MQLFSLDALHVHVSLKSPDVVLLHISSILIVSRVLFSGCESTLRYYMHAHVPFLQKESEGKWALRYADDFFFFWPTVVCAFSRHRATFAPNLNTNWETMTILCFCWYDWFHIKFLGLDVLLQIYLLSIFYFDLVVQWNIQLPDMIHFNPPTLENMLSGLLSHICHLSLVTFFLFS